MCCKVEEECSRIRSRLKSALLATANSLSLSLTVLDPSSGIHSSSSNSLPYHRSSNSSFTIHAHSLTQNHFIVHFHFLKLNIHQNQNPCYYHLTFWFWFAEEQANKQTHKRWISWCAPPHTSTPTGKSLLRRRRRRRRLQRRRWWRRRLPPQTARRHWRVSCPTTPTPKSSTSTESSRAKTALRVPKMTLPFWPSTWMFPKTKDGSPFLTVCIATLTRTCLYALL